LVGRPFAWLVGSVLGSILAACSPAQDKFIAVSPADQADTWAVQRADVECRDELRGEKLAYWLRLRYRVANNPDYISCMQRKGFVPKQQESSLVRKVFRRLCFDVS
jgi:hypothetical protein